MLPIFWQYLVKAYMKIFFLSVSGFIAILLVTRLKEIARFASLCSSLPKVLFFVLYQIPHILPIAISISSFIAAFILFQKLSQTHELTSLRAAGLSLVHIFTPILFFATFLFLTNFYVISELTSYCRMRSKEILHEDTSINPIILLQRQNLLKIKHSYVDLIADSEGKKAKDVLFITPNKSNQRLNLISAKNLKYKNNHLYGKNIHLLSYLANKQEGFDTLLVENQELMNTRAIDLSKFIKSGQYVANTYFLPLRTLLKKSKLSNNLKDSPYVEVIRRLSVAFSALSLTFIGLVYGMQISRHSSKKGLVLSVLFALFILVSFTIGKEMRSIPIGAICLYILPQPILIMVAISSARKLNRGSE